MIRAYLTLFAALVLAGLSLAQEPKTEPASPDPAPQKAVEKPATPAPASPDETKWVAFVGGEVWTVTGPRLPGATVLVKNDKIVRIGGDEMVLPAGTKIVDCKGKHVVPGFIAIASRNCLGVRGNTVREKAKDRVDPFTEYMLMALGSGITTAHQGQGGANEMFGGLFGAPQGFFSGSPRGVLGGVIAKLTYGTIEGYEVRDPAAVYMTLEGNTGNEIQETVDALQKARDLVTKRKEWIQALRDGNKEAKEPKDEESIEALARCLEGELPLFMQASTAKDIRKVLALSDRFAAAMILHPAMEAWTCMGEIGSRPIGLVLCPRGLGGRAARPYRDLLRDGPHGWSIETAAFAGRTGVPWATTTLSTGIVTGLLAGRDVLTMSIEAAFAVRGGAKPEDALASITITPARMLRIADRVGSIEVGKDADILVMDREPLDYRAFVDLAYVSGVERYDRRVVPFWNHIPADRTKPPSAPWHPYGIWSNVRELPESAGSER